MKRTRTAFPQEQMRPAKTETRLGRVWEEHLNMPLLLQLMNQTFWIQNKSFSVIEAMQRGSRALAVVICQGHLIAAPYNHGLGPVVCRTIQGMGYKLLVQD